MSETASSSSDVQEEEGHIGGPTFTPRLYMQRYTKTAEVIAEHCPVADLLIDFGCAEGKLLKLLSSSPDHRLGDVAHFVGVDIDETLLSDRASNCLGSYSDTFSDYCLHRRHCELVRSLYAGSVCVFDPRFAHVDVITALELVEHLTPEDVDGFTSTVFGQYRPRLVVVSTPNSEFNAHFPQLRPGDFRHWDHKFEWTRAEGVSASYPEYSVSYDGVGFEEGDRGPCSQFAIFAIDPEAYAGIKSAKLAAREPLLEPKHELVMVVGHDDDFPTRRTFPHPDSREGEEGRYRVVFHQRLPWSRLSRCRNRLAGSLRSALAELVQACGEENRVVHGKYMGVYVPLPDILAHPEVAQWTQDESEFLEYLLGTEEFWRLDVSGSGLFQVLEELDTSSEDDEDETFNLPELPVI